MTDWIFGGDYGTAPTPFPLLLLSLFLAFLGGHVIAWVYMVTHTGLSYSRSFVNSLMILPTLVALVMMVLSNSLVVAFGMMAVFAMVRFRNILRDTLDTAYILSSIVIGMAAGTQKYSTAVIGLLLLVGIMFYMWYTAFGTRHRYDVIVNLHWSRPNSDLNLVQRLLARHSLKSHLASQRSSGENQGTDLSYRLLLRDPSRVDELISELRGLEGVARVTGMKTEEQSEV